MAQFDFIVDVENRRLVSSFLSTRAASSPSFVLGDQPSMAVRLVRGNSNNPNQPWQYVEPSATQSIRVAVGDLGGAPTAGSFVMSFDGDDTAALPYDATGDEVGLALNLLASITSAGGVTVTDLNGGGYRIAFIDNGARSLVTLDTDSLSPTTGAFVSESITGSATTSSIQLVAIETMPAAFADLTTELPAPNVDINTIRSGLLDTTAEVKQVTITGEPYNGTYSLLIGGIESSFISWDATPEAIVAAVEAIDVTWAGLISVLGTSESYTIEFDKSLGDIGSGTANNDTLTGAKGRSGSLDLNVTGLVELLQGNPSTTATFEIQLFDTTGSVPETVLQTRCAVNQDLIPANPTSSTPIPDYALAIHTHTITDVDGLQAIIDDTVTLSGDQTITGDKIFNAEIVAPTGKFLNGSSSGTISIGGDVNTQVRTADVRKLGSITGREFENSRNIELVTLDSVSATSAFMYIGGRPGGSQYAPTSVSIGTRSDTSTQGSATAIFVDNSQMVGIGTLNPANKLQLGSGAIGFNANSGTWDGATTEGAQEFTSTTLTAPNLISTDPDSLIKRADLSALYAHGVEDHNATNGSQALTQNVRQKVLNNALGAFTNVSHIIPNRGLIWDSTLNSFDFSGAGLVLGDSVTVRMDFTITTSGANDGVTVELDLGIGGNPYTLQVVSQEWRTAGTYQLVVLAEVYMGDTNTLNNPMEIYIVSDSTNDSFVYNGHYVKYSLQIPSAT